MIPTFRNLEHITEEHLQALVDEKVPESRELDYKADIAKDKFCHLMSSFANTSGGCIVVGITDNDDGYGESLDGIEGSPDELTLKLEQSAALTIRPRIILKPWTVPLSNGKYAVLFATPKSTSGPHMWCSGDSKRIYMRLTKSSTLMDIDEIRRSVLRSQSEEAIAGKLHKRYANSLESIRDKQRGCIYLAFSAHLPHGYGEVFAPNNPNILRQLEEQFSCLRHDKHLRPEFDGTSTGLSKSDGWLSIKRNGSVFLVTYEESWGAHTANDDVIREIKPADIRGVCRRWLSEIRSAYEIMDYSGVVYVCASLMFLSGIRIEVNRRRTGGRSDYVIREQHLHMPAFAVDTNITAWESISDDWMERLWNAVGIPIPHDIEKQGDYPT